MRLELLGSTTSGACMPVRPGRGNYGPRNRRTFGFGLGTKVDLVN